MACWQGVLCGCILNFMEGLEGSSKELESYHVDDGELLEVLDETVT